MEERKVSEQKRSFSSQPSFSSSKPGSVTAIQQEKWVQFQLHAPQAHAVSVLGTFNQWDSRSAKFALAKDSQGYWKGSFQLRPGRYEYRFFVDGCWVDDPNATKTAQNKFGTKNAVLEVR